MGREYGVLPAPLAICVTPSLALSLLHFMFVRGTGGEAMSRVFLQSIPTKFNDSR